MKPESPLDNEVREYLENGGTRTKDLALDANATLTELGCHAYFKTIYIGYDLRGVMVAALYKRSDHIELALALPEDHPSIILIDATHLTWRTLPVAASFNKTPQLKEVRLLIAEACSRVASESHSVCRDNDFFTKHKRRPRA